MKRFFLLVLLLIIFALPSNTFAHALGQPPYFKVDGVFTDYYPVPTTSLPDFKLPQDIAEGIFLVNQNIEFEIDPEALPVPAEVVKTTTFLWEYGDGTKAQGLRNSYAYKAPGTYFLNIYADSEQGFGPQLLQSTAINILPSADYKLPKAVIEVNGKESNDPLLDIIEVNFSGEQKFSAGKSDGGSSAVREYFWDMGDMNLREGVEVRYSYEENPYTVFPVLRIKTRDGFVADSFVQIKDETAFEGNGSLISGSRVDWKLIALTVIVSLVLAGILTWLLSRFILKKNKSAS